MSTAQDKIKEPRTLESGTSSKVAVSIALATYNGARHLREQLDSLGRQRLLPCELVITDDGSTDSTLETARAFARSAPFPVHVHSNVQRLGYGSNFLRAASLCTGELIAFCDQDDVWLEEKLSTCVRVFDDEDVVLAVHSAETWDGKARLGTLYPRHERTEVTAPGSTDPLALTPGFAMVFRRKLLTCADLHDRPGCLFGLTNGSIMAHDAWIRLLGAATGKTALLSDVLALYRQHGTNTVGAPSKAGLRRRFQLAMGKVDYDLLADFEAKCSEVLSSIPDDAAPTYVREREALAEQFRRKSSLHRMRNSLYSRNSTLSGRSGSFASLVLSGAYSSGRRRHAIGPKAAFKDLSFGVSGVYKLLT